MWKNVCELVVPISAIPLPVRHSLVTSARSSIGVQVIV